VDDEVECALDDNPALWAIELANLSDASRLLSARASWRLVASRVAISAPGNNRSPVYCERQSRGPPGASPGDRQHGTPKGRDYRREKGHSFDAELSHLILIITDMDTFDALRKTASDKCNAARP
jgi:hypothetical protein